MTTLDSILAETEATLKGFRELENTKRRLERIGVCGTPFAPFMEDYETMRKSLLKHLRTTVLEEVEGWDGEVNEKPESKFAIYMRFSVYLAIQNALRRDIEISCFHYNDHRYRANHGDVLMTYMGIPVKCDQSLPDGVIETRFDTSGGGPEHAEFVLRAEEKLRNIWLRK